MNPLHNTLGLYSFMEADGDKVACLKKAHAYADSIRVMVQHDCWGKHRVDYGKTPYKPKGTWRSYGDKQPYATPYFALMEWNEPWWDEFRAVIKLIGNYIGHVHVSNLEWGCVQQTGWKKTLWPFYACVEKFGDPPDTTDKHHLFAGGIVDPNYQKYHASFQHRLITELKGAGVPFDYESINEYSLLGEFKSYSVDYMNQWYRWFLDDAIDQGLPADTKIIGNGGSSRAYTASLSDIFAVHAISTVDDIVDFKLPPGKVEISFDGGYGGEGDADYKGRRNPTIAQMKANVLKAKSLGYSRFEGFSFNTEGLGQWDAEAQTVVANVDKVNHELFETIATTWGRPLTPWIDPPTPPVVPPPVPTPVPTPTPDTRTCWQKYMAHRAPKDWNFKALFKCWFGKK